MIKLKNLKLELKFDEQLTQEQFLNILYLTLILTEIKLSYCFNENLLNLMNIADLDENFFVVDVKVYQKWYGGDENDFHYFLNAGLIIGVIFKYFGVLRFNFLRFEDLGFKSLNMLSCEDKIVNQKFFYCDKNDIYKDVYVCVEDKFNWKIGLLNNIYYLSLKTKRKGFRDLKKERNVLELYLKEKNEYKNIKYFEYFHGCLIQLKFESYNKNKDIYKQGVVLYFYNNLWLEERKELVIVLENELDIDTMYLITKNCLKEVKSNYYVDFIKVKYHLYNFFEKNTDFKVFFSIKGDSNYESFIFFLFNLKNVYKNFFNILNNNNNNNNNLKYYLSFKTNEQFYKKDLKFLINEYSIFYDNYPDFIFRFKGIVYLAEINLILNKEYKRKKLAIIFFNCVTKKSVIILLYNVFSFIRIIYIFNNFWIFEKIDYNDINEDFLQNITKNKFIENNWNFSNFEFTETKIDRENIKIIKIKDKKDFIIYMSYYFQFASNY